MDLRKTVGKLKTSLFGSRKTVGRMKLEMRINPSFKPTVEKFTENLKGIQDHQEKIEGLLKENISLLPEFLNSSFEVVHAPLNGSEIISGDLDD